MTLQTPATTERLRQGDMSYVSVWVPDIQRAAAFFADVLGWTYAPADAGPAFQVQGQSIAQGLTQLQESAAFLARLGVPLSGVTASTAYVVFVVDSIEVSIERVRAAGGWAGEPLNQPYGRVAACLDNQGMPFSLHEVPAGTPAPRPRDVQQGDVAYLTFEVQDSARARAFFGNLLGWEFSPGRIEDGWQVTNVVPMSGLSGGHPRSTIVPMYRVDDIVRAVERVRELGGQATEPERQPYGITADCTDDQGTRFYLGQF
jgi:predicted enzyme related to lactoylglutathione lyase